MNHNHIGMDRTEQSGLAAAVIIHLTLAAALWFGMQSVPEPVIKPDAISVSLIGEIAPVSTAPDAAAEAAPNAQAEEPQPAPPADAAPEAPAPKPAPALPPKPLPKIDVKPVSAPKVTPPKIIPPKPPIKAQPKAAVKTVPKKIEKPAKSEPVKKPAAAAKAATKPAAKPTAKPIKSGGFGKGFEERIAGVGGSASATPAAAKAPGAGTASGTGTGTPASKSGAEVRRSVTTALAGQIRPFLQSCAPSGVDVDKISTFITVNLAIDGDVTSVTFDKQTGINESNRPQADPLRQCAVKAAKQAAPYRGLDPEYHDLWRSHKLQLKAR